MDNPNPTAKESAPELLPCPLAHPVKNGVRFTGFSNDVRQHIWCYDCGLQFEGQQSETAESVALRWNARVSGDVAPRSVANFEAWTTIDKWLRDNPKATATECLVELTKRIKIEAREVGTGEARRIEARRVEIALGYITRAANRGLPSLPCRVDEITERELAIFNVGSAAVGNLQFIARELDRWPAPAVAGPTEEAKDGIIELLNAALLHPESTQGYVRQVIEMLTAGPTPATPAPDEAWKGMTTAEREQAIDEWQSKRLARLNGSAPSSVREAAREISVRIAKADSGDPLTHKLQNLLRTWHAETELQVTEELETTILKHAVVVPREDVENLIAPSDVDEFLYRMARKDCEILPDRECSESLPVEKWCVVCESRRLLQKYSATHLPPPPPQQRVGERCVKCGHNDLADDGQCAAPVTLYKEPTGYTRCNCHCVFPSAESVQSENAIIYDSSKGGMVGGKQDGAYRVYGDPPKESVQSAGERIVDNWTVLAIARAEVAAAIDAAIVSAEKAAIAKERETNTSVASSIIKAKVAKLAEVGISELNWNELESLADDVDAAIRQGPTEPSERATK